MPCASLKRLPDPPKVLDGCVEVVIEGDVSDFPQLARGHRLELSTGEVIPDLGIPEFGFFVEVDHLSCTDSVARLRTTADAT